MNRTDRGTKEQDKRRGHRPKQSGQFKDDYMEELNSRQGKQGKRHWQQEKQLLKQLDPKQLEEYLLDVE